MQIVQRVHLKKENSHLLLCSYTFSEVCACAFLTAVVSFWGLKISTLNLLVSIEMLMLFWDCMIFAKSDENWLTSLSIILNICGFDKVKRSFVFYREVSSFDFWQLSPPLRLFRRKYEAFVTTLMLSMLYILQLLIILCKWRLTSDKQKNSTEMCWVCLFFFSSSSEFFFTHSFYPGNLLRLQQCYKEAN